MDENREPGEIKTSQEMKKNEPHYGLTPLMNVIRLTLIFCFGTMLSSGNAFSQGGGILLFRHVNQWEGTNIWLVSYQQLTGAPKWKGQTEPPLSVGRAIKIAEQHIAGTNSCWVWEISLTPVAPMSNTGIYYYNIVLGGVSYVGHLRRCIILMDGSIVEPRILGSKSKHYDPWNFDE